MAARPMPYRLEGDMTREKMEQLDEMLQILFDDLRNGNLTVETTQLEGLPLTVPDGGTGITSYNVGDILYADDTDSLTTLGIGTAGQVLTVNAGATAPEWGAGGGGGTPGGNDGDVQYNDAGTFAGHPIAQFGYWSPLTNGSAASPELIFDGNGDTIAIWTVTGP